MSVGETRMVIATSLLCVAICFGFLIRAIGGVESAVREQTKRGVLIQMKSLEDK